MPIQQLKSKRGKKNDSVFSTHSFGSRIGLRPVTKNDFPLRRSGSRGRRPILLGLLRFTIFIILIGSIGLVSLFAWYSKDLPDPNKIIERDLAQSTKIYDRTGAILLYEIHGTERRTSIELADIPRYAIDATIAVEDKNFFKHKGLSLTGIARAIIYEVLSKIGLYNKNVPGGSTLTQQFIKNAVLTTEKSYVRKIKEFVLAYRLEQKFTKDQILKLYFNEIPYGSTAYGIEASSHIYFDKPAKDLTIGEAAILAALPQAPSYYSPYGSHKDELIGRQRYILKLMVEQGYLTQEQATAARDEKIVFKKKREDIKAPHFVFMVKEELSQRYGERLVEQGGLKIITTLDMDKQKIAEDTINEFASKNLEKFDAQNASLVSLDVKTGEVLALVGSKDYFDDSIDGQVNVAVALRQPGSSLKPLIYAEAFNRGYRPETMVFDLVTRFAASGTQYAPQNYDGKERGPVSLRQALQGSLNIPAVKILYLVSVRRAVQLAQEFGYTTLTDPDRYGLSLVLGGGEVRLVEHTNAFAAFAREGVYKPYTDIIRVEDANGETLEKNSDSPGKRVLPREVLRTLSNVLTDNDARAYIFGAANHLTLPDRPVAAKTGTTNNYKDAWTMGYTPSIATGVWVGNNGSSSMKKGADGSVVAAPIWQKYMQTILQGTPVESFKSPEPLPACSKPMLCGTVGNEHVVRINGDNGKLASPYTPESKIKEVVYNEVHEILHYVNTDDPLGPPLEQPETDPQYPLWEEPIKKWAEEKGIVSSAPPTEIDDSFRAEDQPQITWVTPTDFTTITNSNASFQVQVSGRSIITKVQFYLNNLLVGATSQQPFSMVFTPSPLIPNGSYTLVAVATDDSGNEGRTGIHITLDVPRAGEWQVNWSSPANGATYTPASVPAELSVGIQNPQQLKKIDFYFKSASTQNFIGFKDVTNENFITQAWTKPTDPGIYQLYIVATDRNGSSYTLPEISFTITTN